MASNSQGSNKNAEDFLAYVLRVAMKFEKAGFGIYEISQFIKVS